MTHSRKSKLEEAKELLHSKHTNILDCLTAHELDKLKQHRFDAEAYITQRLTSVFTYETEDKQQVSEILKKLDKHASAVCRKERTVIHISRYHKE
jgi:hypothetical protein